MYHFNEDDVRLIEILSSYTRENSEFYSYKIQRLVGRMKEIAKIMYRIDHWRNQKFLSENINEIDFVLSKELEKITSELKISWKRTLFENRAKHIMGSLPMGEGIIGVYPPFTLILPRGQGNSHSLETPWNDNEWAFKQEVLYDGDF